MRIPWILYAALAAGALPFLAVVLRHVPLSQPRRWVLVWSLLVFAANATALVLARRGINNHWLNYLVTPVAGAFALWALSFWQAAPVTKLSFRLLVPLLGLTWAGMVLLVENTQTFSLVAEPFAGLLVLGGAVYTLVAGSFRETANLFKQDWLWIAGGLALYSGAAIALPPTAHWLLTRSPGLVVKAYEVKSWIEVLALVAIARGMLCPTPILRSGGSSSRASSPSPSSSWGSSSPS